MNQRQCANTVESQLFRRRAERRKDSAQINAETPGGLSIEICSIKKRTMNAFVSIAVKHLSPMEIRIGSTARMNAISRRDTEVRTNENIRGRSDKC